MNHHKPATNNQPFPYQDILYLPRPVSKTHRPMPIADRAAQFAPFAALTGHGDLIRKTQQIHEEKFEQNSCIAEESDI